MNIELFLYVASLIPRDSCFAFDKNKLMCVAKFYPSEFSCVKLMGLESHLKTFIKDVWSDNQFLKLKGFANLPQMLVKTKKHIVYPMIYLLVKLALILPVTTATVERCFSTIDFMKIRMQNHMRDE